MVKVMRCIKMVAVIEVALQGIGLMVKESIHGLMERFLMASGLWAKRLVLEFGVV